MTILKKYKSIGTWQKVDTHQALMELSILFPTALIRAKLENGETLESEFAYYKKG